jgi:hypothetical protein
LRDVLTEDTSYNFLIAIAEFAAGFEIIQKLKLLLVESHLQLSGFVIHAIAP